MKAIESIDIEVFQRNGSTGFNFSSAAIFDSAISLRIVWNYQSYDSFTLKVPLSIVNVALFQADNILLMQGEFFYVDKTTVDKDTDEFMTVEGKSLAAKAMMRIINSTYQTNSQLPELVAYNLLYKHVTNPTDANRKIAYLSLPSSAPSLTTTAISYQDTYDVVLDQVTNLMTTYGFGMKETPTNYQNPAQRIDLYKGQDLSNVVQFSKDFENLIVESYEHSNYDERNTWYVLGEGEGTARQAVYINMSNTGLERKEAYADARDLQQTVRNNDGTETTLTNAQYQQVLTQRGKDKMAERVPVLEVNGTINLDSELFKFRTDYNVGDRVRITSKTFNLTKTSVLNSVEEVWEKGHTMTPTFGNSSPTITDIIKRSK